MTENRRDLGSDIVDNLTGIKEKLPGIIESIQKTVPIESSLSDEYFHLLITKQNPSFKNP